MNEISKIIFMDEDAIEYLKEKDKHQYFVLSDKSSFDTELIVIKPNSEMIPLRPNCDISVLLSGVESKDLYPGSVVVRAPYNSGGFVSINDFEGDVLINKFRVFTTFCICLGATEVFVEQIEASGMKIDRASSAKMNVDGKSLFVNVKGGVEDKEQLKMSDLTKKLFNLRTLAKGQANFEKANEILKKYRLESDNLFTHFLDMSEASSGNLVHQECTINSSREFSKSFDSSLKGKLSALTKVYKANVSLQKKVEEITSGFEIVDLKVVVKF